MDIAERDQYAKIEVAGSINTNLCHGQGPLIYVKEFTAPSHMVA
jgi:hypothetical protein